MRTALIAVATFLVATWVAPASAAFSSDRFSVEVTGEGPDIIFIPGFSAGRESFAAEAQRLSATHRVHLVQLAGFAGEPWTHGEGPFLAPVVEELHRYIAEGGIKPAIVGHSMGVVVGLMLAQQHPDDVARLMCIDNLPFFGALYGPAITPEIMQPLAQQSALILLTASDELMRSSTTTNAERLANDPVARARMVEWALQSDRNAMAAAMREVMVTDLRPGLAAMTMPVTVLYAGDPGGTPLPDTPDNLFAREYAALAGATLIRVDGARHFIMADQPEIFSQHMDVFLAE